VILVKTTKIKLEENMMGKKGSILAKKFLVFIIFINILIFIKIIIVYSINYNVYYRL